MPHHMMPSPSMGHQMMSAPSGGHHRTPSMIDNLEPNYHHDNYHHLEAHTRPSSRASSRVHDYDSISRPASRVGSIRADYSPTQPRLGLPSRPSSRNLTAEALGLNSLENLLTLLSARLESAALNSEINGGRRSRANSRLDPMEDDYRQMDHGHLATDLNAMNLNGGRSRANSRTEMPVEDFSRSSRSQLGNDFDASNGMAGMRSRSTVMWPTIEGEQYHTRTWNEPNFQNDGDLNGGLVGLGRSPRGDVNPNLYASERGLGNLTNEELSQLSTEQLELILSHRSPMRNPTSGWEGARGDDRSIPADGLGTLHGRHESGSMGGIDNLEVGEGQSRGHNRRGSRLGVEESPLFGDPRDYHSPIEPHRPLSRADTSSSRQYGGPSSLQRYDQPSEAAMIRSRLNSPNTASSVYDAHTIINTTEMDIRSATGKKSEQPGARIVQRFGPVEASSRGSPRSAAINSRYDEMNDRQDMHQAVKNLITEANQRGANGVVSLRVCDTSDGSYVATGEAVLLETM
ncbi:hypothetical protein H4Q26_003153 [Puccinia striiformis f. sp. tritici PST-130]|nr:hypothetical protein H4Q26_003153 [Puccinia striiformis f. sp. tritici PST-130]